MTTSHLPAAPPSPTVSNTGTFFLYAATPWDRLSATYAKFCGPRPASCNKASSSPLDPFEVSVSRIPLLALVMGCTGSKQVGRSRGWSPSPCVRSHSLPIHYGGDVNALHRGVDDHHAVSLTSSTLGSLVLDRDDLSFDEKTMVKSTNDLPAVTTEANVVKGLVRAKTWSGMVDRRMPESPTMTPSNEPEVINAWELMAGLEDASSPHLSRADAVDCSLSFRTSRNPHRSSPDSELSSAASLPKPQRMQLSPVDSVVSDFDPAISTSFREALDALSPQQLSQSILQSPELDEEEKDKNKEPSRASATTGSIESAEGRDVPETIGIVRARINEFQQKIDVKRTRRNANSSDVASSLVCPPGGEGKVVFYFTSIRGILRTFEDCWAVRVILRGYGVRVDERDVSMHAGFKEELIGILGPGYGGNSLPRVFADGHHLGGADELRHLHEVGRLAKLMEFCEMEPQGKGRGDAASSCDGCGDVRFVLCRTCSGSCKVYVDAEEEEDDDFGRFRRCPDCNENGLVRCPLCCLQRD
ncbi:hypothetical protein B296_00055318 [Ensete ventricosum]|uniref:Glutaredoxin domain-containing protein n=1 Tax=Ensete ventricosum TaxID=4639 RepID=A0A426XPE2_ENSVE|nr:hypothetical protein B296_00055318 [Ensete ventricosum]